MTNGLQQAVILAGGKGTRIQAIAGDLPKPMLPVGGKPLLQVQIEMLRKYGITDIVLYLGYRSEAIESHFGDGSTLGVNLRYHIEETPLGTAGAILQGADLLEERFAVLYGDTVMNIDVAKFYDFHRSHQADVSLFLHPNDHPYDSDLVELDADKFVRHFRPYPHPEGENYPNLVNAAFYILEKKSILPFRSVIRKGDFIKDLFPKMLATSKIAGYESREYIKDMGTPDRYARVQRDWESGKVAAGSLDQPKACVFLDRDGTLTKSLDYVNEPSELELFPDAAESLKRLNSEGLLAVVVTNQPVIARGTCSLEGLQKIHNKLETELGQSRAYLDRIYFCPHHPDSGFEGERKEYKIRCDCRKPQTGLVDRAVKDLSIDRHQSWMIGDTTTDLALAQKAGLRSILVRTGYAGADGKYPLRPDYEFTSLHESIGFIVDTYPNLRKRADQITENFQGRSLLIGGLARSGKSLLASALRESLIAKGLEALVIPLDSFLKPEAQRGAGVLGRYDISAISSFLKTVKALKSSTALEIPLYDRGTRGPGAPLRLEITPRTVLIWEGVPAFLVPDLREGADLKIYVDRDEKERQAAFYEEYRHRGFQDPDIASLYNQRELDENVVIREMMGRADIVEKICEPRNRRETLP